MDTSTSKAQRWQISVWYGAGLGLLLTIAVLLTFTGVSIWRTTTLVAERTTADLSYTFASIGMINLTLLRLIAVLIGAAICFSGLAVSFFAHAMAVAAGHLREITKADWIYHLEGASCGNFR